jgi:hypothetical protein
VARLSLANARLLSSDAKQKSPFPLEHLVAFPNAEDPHVNVSEVLIIYAILTKFFKLLLNANLVWLSTQFLLGLIYKACAQWQEIVSSSEHP